MLHYIYMQCSYNRRAITKFKEAMRAKNKIKIINVCKFAYRWSSLTCF